MWLLRFLKSNVFYLLWFLFYFGIAWLIFGANRQSLMIVSIIYGVSMTIALSPLGEVLLRFTHGCRPPSTEEERKYLLPLFEEVCEDAREINKSLNMGLKIYVMDEMYVNAFTIGRKTIAVTRGALNTFNKEELKGIIAHELGHMTHGHTKALLLTYIGNVLFTAIVQALRLGVKIVDALIDITLSISIMALVFKFLSLILNAFFEISVFLFVWIGDLILSLNRRSNEYMADKFAYQIGLGKQLISAMYVLQKISMGGKVKLSEKLKATHPHMTKRIGRLEQLEAEGFEE